MKRTALARLVCLTAVVLSGCAHFSSLQNNSWHKYENNRLGFTIDYPKDWVVAINGDYAVTFSNIPRSQWGEGVGIDGLIGGMSIDIIPFKSNPNFDCYGHAHDYEALFDDDDLGKPADSNTFIKIVCRDEFVIVLGFTPKSVDSKTEKKLLENILNTFQTKPHQ